MTRSAIGDDLEVVEVDSPATPRRRWRPPGLFLALLGVALLAAAVGPGRAALARRGFQHADHVWAEAQSLGHQYERARGLLLSLQSPEDIARVKRTTARLDAEVTARYARLRRAVGGDWRLRLDGRTRTLRTAMTGSLAYPKDDTRRREVEAQLARARTRWGGAEPRRSASPLRSADAEVARLRHFVDRVTGVTLVTATRDGFVELDLDASRRRVAPAPGIAIDAPVTRMVLRDGWAAFNDNGGQAWIVSADLGPPRVALGTGLVLPSDRPDAIWLWSALGTVSELDRAGTAVRGPFSLPFEGNRQIPSVVGVAPAGVIVRRDEKGFTDVVDPATGKGVRRLPGLAVAVHGNLVAWVEDGTAATRVTDLTTGVQVTAIAQGYPVSAAFSPDGHLLVVAGYNVDVVDLRTLRVERVADRAGADRLTWDQSGRWLFFQSAAIAGWDAQLHEVFHPRFPPTTDEYVLLAARAR